MPESTLNCQGLSCPGPVLRVKKHIEEHSPTNLTVIVDNDAARENVSRFLSNAGYVVHSAKDGELWKLEARRIQSEVVSHVKVPAYPQSDSSTKWLPKELAERAYEPETRRIAVLLTAPVIGSGDDELGAKLMKNFLATLPEIGKDLWRVILLNGAVRLATKDSPVLEQLTALSSDNVSILVCGTCLEHFGLMESKAVGETTNMLDVVTSLQLADSVIRP